MEPETKKEQVLACNLYSRTLVDIRNGDCLNEASSELAKLIRAVRKCGGKGEITIKLMVEPAERGMVEEGESQRLFITDSIVTKIPKPKKARALFFSTDAGGLQRTDPNQRELPLRTVPTEDKKPLQKVGDAMPVVAPAAVAS